MADPTKSFERVVSRGGDLEVYENLPFQQAVNNLYYRLVKCLAHESCEVKLVLIDSSDTIENIHKKIWNILAKNADVQ